MVCNDCYYSETVVYLSSTSSASYDLRSPLLHALSLSPLLLVIHGCHMRRGTRTLMLKPIRMHSCLFEKWTATSEKHMGHHMTCPSFFGVALSLTILACLLIDDRLCHHTAAPTTLLPSFSFSFLSSLKGG